MMSKNSIVPFLKDYLIKFLTRPFLLDTNDKKLLNEWMPYEQKVQRLKEEAVPFRQGADANEMVLLDFHTEMLDRDVKEHFYELLDKYGIMPQSLSPSVLAISIELIENEFCN